MIERIGKYRVLERIGRGGMGIVLKAHDPVLDRTVALKVIAPDVEVTEELRTRFFREAQACARLSHPNIVTVFDLGDVDGRLFIVMQFLDGEELRQVIAQRRPMPLEDKISVMMQVCDGVAYAHQHGVVHRDIKPGNIFLLRDRGVKILDFGVARIVSADAGLTRTGLIMGTLRYMAPEQARGRADHRSDIFSVGTVFYELLAHRPAFPGDDPMEILEALRTQDPPLLSDVDAAIPADLADIIARALRKDPAQRIQDLLDMRRELDAVRRRLRQAADVVRARLHDALRRLHEEQAAAADALGGELADDETLPILEEASSLAALEVMERNIGRRRERVRAVVARATELRAAVERGVAALSAGDLEAAATILEPIVREIPEHVRARTALEQVRAALQERRREAARRARELAMRRRDTMLQALAEAREAGAPDTAPDTWRAADRRAADGEQALAREDLDVAGEHLDAAAALYRRARAEALEAQRERARAAAEAAARAAIRRQEREDAERSRARLEPLRAVARAAGAATDAERIWTAAEQQRTGGESAIQQEAFSRARERFEQAAELYRGATEEATAAARRRARQVAVGRRDAMLRALTEAREAGAPDAAPDTWRAADRRAADGEQALAREDLDVAGEHLDAAAALYRRARAEALEAQRERARAAAEAAARAAIRRQEREDAERSLARLEPLRAAARAAGAATDAERIWTAAEQQRTEGESALQQEAFSRALERFEYAATLYRQAAEQATAVADRRARAVAEVAFPGPDETAATVQLPAPPAPPQGRAERQTTLPGRGLRVARLRPWMGVVGGAVAVAVVGVLLAVAPSRQDGPEIRGESPSTTAESQTLAEIQPQVAAAREQAERAERAEADRAAAEARRRAEAEQAAAEARRRAEADRAAAEARRRAETEQAAAEARRRAEADRAAAEARRRAETEQAAAEARRRAEADRVAAVARQRRQTTAEELRDRATAARLEAERGPTPRAVAPLMASAQGKEAEGRAALDRQDFEAAARAFRAAEADYLGAMRQAAKAREADHERELGEARAAAARSRSRATQADAPSLAKELFDMASGQWARAEAQERGGDTVRATHAFRASAQLYGEAAQRAEDARQARTHLDTAQSRRELAMQAGADMLAKELFDGGSARLAEGNTLAKAQDWGAASRAYREAAERYGAAERRVRDIARLRLEAGAAKDRREQALSVGAERLAPELFAAAAARHVEADRLARGPDVVAAIPVYRDAAERYGVAEQRARASSSPPARPQAQEEIRRVLGDYARALEARDAGLLLKLRPGLDAEELRRYRQMWDAGATMTVVLKVERIDVQGDDAEVTGRRQDIVVRPDGGRERGAGERAFRFKLKRGRDGWLIDAVQ